MAEKNLAQPTFYVDSQAAIDRQGELFAVTFGGINMMLTPYALMSLTFAGKRAFADWNAINNAKAAGYMIDDPAPVVPFRKRPKIVRAKGEAL